MQPIIPTAAHTSSSVDIGQPPPPVRGQYAKGKRPLEGGERGQVLKAPKVESGSDRNKGKAKSSTAFFPRFREYYYPIVNPGEAQYLYELHESKLLPKKNVQLTPEKLETLLGTVPTEEDTTRSPQILEVIRSTEIYTCTRCTKRGAATALTNLTLRTTTGSQLTPSKLTPHTSKVR
jgi:hypothetical protein